MTTRQKKQLAKALISLLILGISWALFKLQQNPNLIPAMSSTANGPPGTYAVTEFVDGDTIAVDMQGKNEKVRFIGVDTPETHDPRKAVQCFGQAAANFTKQRIGKQRVRLEADPTNTNRDRYNRLLRYVYLPDNTLVNAEIIKQGYGFAYLSFPFTKSEEFRKYEQAARAANKGLWGSCKPTLDNGNYRSNDAGR